MSLIRHTVIGLVLAVAVWFILLIAVRLMGLYDVDDRLLPQLEALAALLVFIGYGLWRFFRVNVEIVDRVNSPPDEGSPR